MDNPEQISKNKLLFAGIVLIPVMLSVLILTSIYRNSNDDFFGSGGFFINYIFAIGFLIIVRAFFKLKNFDRNLIIIVLILFSISSFTLNNSIAIFARFTVWTKVYLILFFISFLGICYIQKLPKVPRYFIFFFLGAGIIISAYFAVYLTPLYPVSIIGLIFFGLTIHILIPLFITIAVIFIYAKLEKTRTEKILFYSGIAIPIAITVVFLYQWGNFKNEIHKSTSSIITRPDNTLPEWVLLCQDMPTDKFSQKIIKGNLAFDTFQILWDGWGNNIFDEVKRHDPLVNVGLAILGDIDLDSDTRVKILKSQFDARHLAQRKLWSGRNLGTIEVLNNVKVYPEFRLAYSEKIITVKNFTTWRNDQKEAAFTFYLPEGSVATSLSLWINGKEEVSRLTTRSKADSAYVSIVGNQRRDPALLHWQEGNTLTVTIFPCTPEENRRFKIGITSPLQKTGDKLKIQNVYFDGPVSHRIMETSQVKIESEHEISNINLPEGFKKGLDNKYTYNGKFRPYWEISFTAPVLSLNEFNFNDYSYSIKESEKQKKEFNPKNIYLDINKSWSLAEYKKVLAAFSGKKIYAHHDKLIEIDEANAPEIFKTIAEKNFSLFPFNEISDWGSSLVISKSADPSPNLSDLEGSEFLDNLIDRINTTKEKVNLFQIGEVTSPFLKSLKEFQVLNLHSGDISELDHINNEGYFYSFNTDSSIVNLDIAGISIVKDSTHAESKAPDHLLRLFAYNTIMKQLGRSYFNNNPGDVVNLSGIANEAYIVSPVSSLIVLETKNDYDRFEIPENENSLKNASVKSSGAIPEPGEWMLITLFVCILFVLFFHKWFPYLRWK